MPHKLKSFLCFEILSLRFMKFYRNTFQNSIWYIIFKMFKIFVSYDKSNKVLAVIISSIIVCCISNRKLIIAWKIIPLSFLCQSVFSGLNKNFSILSKIFYSLYYYYNYQKPYYSQLYEYNWITINLNKYILYIKVNNVKGSFIIFNFIIVFSIVNYKLSVQYIVNGWVWILVNGFIGCILL
jgi:hypothetical protein